MIQGKVFVKSEDGEAEIFSAWFGFPPRVGEYLWVASADAEIRAKYATTSFRVAEVAHWCSPGFVPAGDQSPIHALAIYVIPLVLVDGVYQEVEG